MLRCIVPWPESSRPLIEMSGRHIVLSKDWKAGYRPKDRMVSMSMRYLYQQLILLVNKLLVNTSIILLHLNLVGKQSDQKDEIRAGRPLVLCPRFQLIWLVAWVSVKMLFWSVALIFLKNRPNRSDFKQFRTKIRTRTELGSSSDKNQDRYEF